MATIEHDGASIYWEAEGHGPHLMMVAGLGGVARTRAHIFVQVVTSHAVTCHFIFIMQW